MTRSFTRGEVRGRLGGVLDRLEVADALRSVDIVVIPSRSTEQSREQFGRVVLEAMFSGCAVVAYASGAIPEVTGGQGVLVEEGDVEGLSLAIAHLLSDEDFRLKTAQVGRARALARYHPMGVARELVALWNELRPRDLFE